MPSATRWMDLEITALIKKEKDKYHDGTYMWNLKSMTQRNSCAKQKQVLRLRIQTKGYIRRKGVGKYKLGVWDQQVQATICKIDKCPTIYSPGNYTQYPNKP